jgi:hypothetical protein
MLSVNDLSNAVETVEYIDNIISNKLEFDITWMGDGNTSKLVIEHLKSFLL